MPRADPPLTSGPLGLLGWGTAPLHSRASTLSPSISTQNTSKYIHLAVQSKGQESTSSLLEHLKRGLSAMFPFEIACFIIPSDLGRLGSLPPQSLSSRFQAVNQLSPPLFAQSLPLPRPFHLKPLPLSMKLKLPLPSLMPPFLASPLPTAIWISMSSQDFNLAV